MPGGDEEPFLGYAGPKVTLRGTLGWAGEGTIDLDLYRPDPSSLGGRERIGKFKLPPGPFEIQVPAGYGPMAFEAFIDPDRNGPGPGDPRGCYPGGSVIIGKSDVEGVDIALAVAKDGKVSTCGGSSPPPAAGRR